MLPFVDRADGTGNVAQIVISLDRAMMRRMMEEAIRVIMSSRVHRWWSPLVLPRALLPRWYYLDRNPIMSSLPSTLTLFVVHRYLISLSHHLVTVTLSPSFYLVTLKNTLSSYFDWLSLKTNLTTGSCLYFFFKRFRFRKIQTCNSLHLLIIRLPEVFDMNLTLWESPPLRVLISLSLSFPSLT